MQIENVSDLNLEKKVVLWQVVKTQVMERREVEKEKAIGSIREGSLWYLKISSLPSVLVHICDPSCESEGGHQI